jgi:hypothetical protein
MSLKPAFTAFSALAFWFDPLCRGWWGHHRRFLVGWIPAGLGHAELLIIVFKNVNVGQHLSDGFRLGQSFAPGFFLDGAHNEILVANDRRIVLTKHTGQQVFNFVFVSNQQVAGFAVATGIIEGNRVHWIDVDEQGYFALPALFLAVWTPGQTLVWVGIEDKIIPGWQVTELWGVGSRHKLKCPRILSRHF